MKRILARLVAVVACVAIAWPPAIAQAAPGFSLQPASLAASSQPVLSIAAADWQPVEPHERQDISITSEFTATSMGIGGHGAAFDPLISPFDSDTMLADCDMGGVYVTHDGGGNWDIKNLEGVVWDLQSDPSTPGRFYACGSGLWRSDDNGDTWSLLWPNPETVEYTPAKVNHGRTYYFSTDSFPDAHVVESMVVDPQDPNHLVAMTAPAANAPDDAASTTPWRYLCESVDGGRSFECIAQYRRHKLITLKNFENTHVFVEHAAPSNTSRVVIANPDGIYEVDRTQVSLDQRLKVLYEAPITIGDARQVIDAQGTHYIVLENKDDAFAEENRSRVRLWHTTDFANPNATVDMTPELAASLPRYSNSAQDGSGTDYEIKYHNMGMVIAPSMDRMYFAYRSYDATGAPSFQGVNGLVTYDSSRAEGKRFQWAFGLRRWWNREDAGVRITPDQNCLMARAHSDSSFTFFGMAADPRNPKAIAISCHAAFFYSPDIDADVGKIYSRDKVNLYPRYATTVRANPLSPTNPSEAFMRSNGLEVTYAYRLAIDPFDPDHLLLCLDDAGRAESFDGGDTWTSRYTQKPSGVSDTCLNAVFDEGRQGVVYATWHASGGGIFSTSASALTTRGLFARSTDGGDSWDTEYSTGLPENVMAARIAVEYPRDSSGNITDGERTIYAATMGHGFYVSHDSGRHFAPMNAGIPTHPVAAGGNTYDTVWARDVMVTDDGRLFGLTQFSSLGPKDQQGRTTHYSTQSEATYGNVFEWDPSANGGAGQWVKLPLNSAERDYNQGLQVRQPRAMCYDGSSRTLYVAGVGLVGPYETRQRWTNFGGGLYAYHSDKSDAVGAGTAEQVGWASSVLGEGRNVTGVKFDALGRLWIATEDGDIYYRGKDGTLKQVCKRAFRLCHDFDMAGDGTVYITTHGISAIRIKPTDAGLAEPVTTTLPDGNLYSAVCEQLRQQRIAYTGNDAAHTLSLSGNAHAQLAKLELNNRDISSVEGLGALANLQELDLSNNSITDLTPLAGLANLETLNASGNALVSTGKLPALSQLKRLELAKNAFVDDASGDAACTTRAIASKFPALSYLDLSHNLLRYTAGLNGLSALAHLDLYDNAVRDLAGLSGLAALAHLDLGENNERNETSVQGLGALDNLTALTYLDFSENNTPAVVDHLANLGNLAFLQVQGNGIEDFSKLGGLVKLETLIAGNNKPASIQPLFSLVNLKELDLQRTSLPSLAGVFTDTSSPSSIVWPQLRKLDISGNTTWGLRSEIETLLLYRLFQGAGYQLNYRYDRMYQGGGYPYADNAVNGLVKTDASNPRVRYVTYDDFGARHDGAFDDYNAMVNAHQFANSYQAAHPEIAMEVRAVPGATYHIFNYYNVDWHRVGTNVDWTGAKFVVHDEAIENKPGRYVPLFVMEGLGSGADDKCELGAEKSTAPLGWTVGKGTKSLAGLSADFDAALAQLNAKGYERYYVQVEDFATKHYIRAGSNANGGMAQWDGIIVDAQGALQGEFQWDFDQLTRVQILPIATGNRAFVKGGTFESKAIASKAETPYTTRGGGKPIYYYRDLDFRNCGNLEVSGLVNTVPDDAGAYSGSYRGFLTLGNCADVQIRDCSFFARKYSRKWPSWRSTYGFSLNYNVNLALRNVGCNEECMLDDTRYGVVQTNHNKHVTFDACTLNRIDAHEGIYDLAVRDSTIGVKGLQLTGQGPLCIERSTVKAATFLPLRGDYGSTWDGEVRIIDCTHEYHGTTAQCLVDFSTSYDTPYTAVHDFGYPLRFPDLYVENLTVDERYFDPVAASGKDAYYIVPNGEGAHPEGMPASYWPERITVNGLKFVNCENVMHGGQTAGHAPSFHMTATTLGSITREAGGVERDYWAGDVTVMADGADVTRTLIAGGGPVSADYVQITVAPSQGDAIANGYDLVKDGQTVESASALEGPWRFETGEAGRYELRVRSADSEHGWEATRTFAFTLDGTDGPPASDDTGDQGESGAGNGAGADGGSGSADTGHGEATGGGSEGDGKADSGGAGADGGDETRGDAAGQKDDSKDGNADGAKEVPVRPIEPEKPVVSETAATPKASVRPVFRVANPKTGERLYVVSAKKASSLARGKWRYEGVAFYAPAKSGKPVYRLVNKKDGRNLYTTVKSKSGWKNRGRAFYAMKSGGIKVYRLKHKKSGVYLLTKKASEVKRLKKSGWGKQSVAFRAIQ